MDLQTLTARIAARAAGIGALAACGLATCAVAQGTETDRLRNARAVAQVNIPAEEDLPAFGATLSLWVDRAGAKHVTLAGTERQLACSYEREYVLAQVDGGALSRVACTAGAVLTLDPALYDGLRGATAVVIEADTDSAATHRFTFRVAGRRLPD
jgi:hypothetical protein